MEKVIFPKINTKKLRKKNWITTGAKNRARRRIITYYLTPEELERHNLILKKKYEDFSLTHSKCEMYKVENAEYIIIAFGISARICKKTITMARERGIMIGLIRPLTIAPFPEKTIYEFSRKAKSILVVEMNLGQMFDDVKLAINGRAPIYFYGRTGGSIPMPSEILFEIEKMTKYSKP
jgi:2-oxoglutarate/2-oxoacid ferredoxin oxidoreductase subunit alpha